ncbi:MAG: hypothetical protein EPO38_06295 [Rhizorhabdus sp.]|nr:MAG: hypothetical protein EPO38_06295 [Rhizorhabdus sp.]
MPHANRLKTSLRSGASILLAAMASQALAQAGPDTASAASPADDSAGGLQEIVVTAQKCGSACKKDPVSGVIGV